MTTTIRRVSRSSRSIAVLTVCAAVFVGASAGAAQAARVLPPLVSAGQIGQEVQMQGNDVRQGPLSADDRALIRRWAELFADVLGEFRADRRDAVANIEADFSTREICIRRVTGDGWVDRTLTKQELATADLRALAKQLYDESKSKAKTG